MKSCSSCLCLSLIASFAILCGVARSNAEILIDQEPFPDGGVESQSMPDMAYDCLTIDDFTVDGTGWRITKVTTPGVEVDMGDGNGTHTVAVKLGLFTSPNFSGMFATYDGVEDENSDLVFSTPFDLAPGHYYLSGYVVRPTNGGYWCWTGANSTTTNGDNAYNLFHFHNGHGDFVLDAGGDFAFKMEGERLAAVPAPSGNIGTAVPEPSGNIGFGLGAFGVIGLYVRRRRIKSFA